MDFIKELLETEKDGKKKSKLSRTTRHKVYHADYMKTKNKPYRKYDPDESHAELHEDQDVEFGGERGGNMEIEPAQDQEQEFTQDQDVAQGAEAEQGDFSADLERIIDELSELLSLYDEAHGEEEQPEEMPPEEMPPEEPDHEEGQESPEEQNPQGGAEENRFSPQFSSWLQRMSGIPLKEYGPSTMFPQAHVAKPAVSAGPTKDVYKKQCANKVREIAARFSKEANVHTALAKIKQAALAHHHKGGKHGERIYNIFCKHMAK